MNIEDIKESIKEIESKADDPEVAHALEDALYEKFISSLAEGTFEGNIQEGAAEVIKTGDIDFNRWYA